MVLKIFAHQNADLFKALITAKYAGVHVDVTEADASQNVAGKIPSLQTEDGVIFEANAIVRYIARVGGEKANLYGKSTYEAGLIDQWVDFAFTSIDLAAFAWLLPIEGIIPNNGLATKKAGDDVRKIFLILDSHLLARTYLVGNRVSIADIVVASSLVRLFELVLDPAFRSNFVNATRWFTTIVNQPNFLAVKGPITLAEKVAVPPTKEKEKKPKEEKPKQEKPKQEKPAKVEKPKAEEPEDNGEDDEPKEKEKKNPLDDLPKSSFILDEWKRTYKNNDKRTVANPWFFEHFDPAGYSVFWCSYKYPDGLTDKVYQTNNLIQGFMQRLEKLHKYAFGVVGIFGDPKLQEIHGVWIFRGPEVPPAMLECDDYEVYDWWRADLNDAVQKKTFEDFLAGKNEDWDGEGNGEDVTLFAGFNVPTNKEEGKVEKTVGLKTSKYQVRWEYV